MIKESMHSDDDVIPSNARDLPNSREKSLLAKNAFQDDTNYLILALLLHLLLFFCFSFIIIINKNNSLRQQATPTISSYIEANHSIHAQPIKNKKLIAIKKTITHHFIAKNITSSKKITATDISIHPTNLIQEALLKLLHHAIAAHQQYPDIAIAANESGQVVIRFKLYPNGEIDEVHVVQTSGYPDLDTAALQAIHAAAPFHTVRQYLKQSSNFDIPIIFE